MAVRPRDVLIETLARSPAAERGQNPGFKDIAAVVEGKKNGQPLTVRVDTTAWPNETYGVSGGTLVVGAPPAIVARRLAAGHAAAAGVFTPETGVDPHHFFAQLAARGVRTEMTITEQVA